MLTVKGIYNGNEFVALESFPKNKTFKVMITFIEELDEIDEIRAFSAQTDSLEFWNGEKEDIYQDFLVTEKV
jgi:hypothetical protein